MAIPMKDGKPDFVLLMEIIEVSSHHNNRDQITQHLKALYTHAIKEAAKVCDNHTKPMGPDDEWRGKYCDASKRLAIMIRELKEK